MFVLGGGGNMGAIQVGMLQAAVERGIVPDAVVGCSVGAINGAALAADPTRDGVERLRELWLAPGTAAVFEVSRFEALRLLTRRGAALQTSAGLEDLMDKHFSGQGFDSLAVPLHVVATSLVNGRERWFSAGPLTPALLASAALPGVYPPVVIDGEPFIDGGVVNNVPISKAAELQATRVVVFHVGNFERQRPAPRRPIDVLVQAFSIARGHRFHLDVASGLSTGAELVVVPGLDPGRLRYNDFSRSRELIERGRASAAAFFDTHSESAVNR